MTDRFGIGSVRQALAQDVRTRIAENPRNTGPIPIQAAIAFVAHHLPVVGVADQEALGDAVDGVLQQGSRVFGFFLGLPQILFGFNLCRDIAPDAAIAGKDAVLVMHRHATDAHMAHLTVLVDLIEAEVTKRLMGQQSPPVVLPPSRVVAGIVQLPSQLADRRLFIPGSVLCPLRLVQRERDKAQLRVLLPEPVGSEFGEIAEPSLVFTQRGLRAGKRGVLLLLPAHLPPEQSKDCQ